MTYFALVDEFVQAVFRRYPKALLQFEDFSRSDLRQVEVHCSHVPPVRIDRRLSRLCRCHRLRSRLAVAA